VGRLPAVLAVCAALAGCGGDDGSKSTKVPVSTLDAAVRATQAGGSYVLKLGGFVDVQGQGLPIRGGGFLDARRERGRITVQAGPIRRVLEVSPGTLLGSLRAVDSVRRVGTETVDGARTTHYYAQVDLTRYARTARPEDVRALNRVMREVGDSVPVDVWIDAAHRIRRMRTSVGNADFQAVPQVDLRRGPPPR
jgi:hypothetical protein